MDPARAYSDDAGDGHRGKRPLSDDLGVVADVHTQPEHRHSVASSHTPHTRDKESSDDTDTQRASKAARTDNSSPMASTTARVATAATSAVTRIHGVAGAAAASAAQGRFQSRFAITFGEGERSLAHPTTTLRPHTLCGSAPWLLALRLYT